MPRTSFALKLVIAVVVVWAGTMVPAAGVEPGNSGQRLSPDEASQPVTAVGGVTASRSSEAPKAPSSRLAESDPALLGRTDATPVRVMIKFDYDATASYAGGVAGLAATSPSVTGRALTGTSAAERNYESHIAAQEQAIVSQITRRVPATQIGRSLRRVYGGVSAVVPANRIGDLLEIDGVVAVQENSLRQPMTDSSPSFIGADTIYGDLGTTANAGEGVIYGNLDTGIWPEHPSFEDLGNLGAPPGPARECNFGDNPLTPEDDPFVCQNKLIGGAHFTDDYDALEGDDPYQGTARDGDGHGTHTSSTSAGNMVDSAPIFDVERGPIHGIAPGAWVMEYKVCGPQGCFDSDSAAAVEQAIVDGVDVINFSIGGGARPFSDAVELAFLDAYAAGVFVSASAGNDGPDASTAEHLSPWVTTVGASTQTREFQSVLTLNADNGDSTVLDGVSITPGVGPLPVVLASDPPYSDALCSTVPPPGTFAGKIVACQRGEQARTWKGFVVSQGGGEGMILYNPSLADTETDNHFVPTVHLADGTDLLAFMGSHTGVTGSFTDGASAAGQGDVMAAFSSRGPGGNFIKPDITAPGVQILAGASPTPPAPTTENGAGSPGEYFQAIAGTSMSSPHIAGSAILLAHEHPNWTPGQIKSAIMTTATTDVVKEDLVTPADPFDFGAGRVDLNNAGSANLTISETASRFFALGNDPANAVNLNIPSVNAPIMPGRVTTTRVVQNVSNQPVQVAASAHVDGGAITVQPRNFRLAAGRSIELTIEITADENVTGQHFGAVELETSPGPDMHLPVAFVPAQGSVSLVQACTPDSIPAGGSTTCNVTAQNNSFNDTTVSLHSRVDTRLAITGANGATLTSARTAELVGVNLTGQQPGVPALFADFPFDSYCSIYDYCPLDLFGGTLTVPVGDETIVNINGFGSFVFAGEAYDSIGVTSNGYAVAGGGTAADIAFEPPQVPDPARPNNVLAPFWTDLNGAGTQGILANVLCAGPSCFLVVEWRVAVFGTDPTNPANQRVFQLWAGLNGFEDLTLVYDPANLPADPDGLPLAVGAENVNGSGGEYITTPPTEDIFILSTDPTPGASVSYQLNIQGKQRGTGHLITEMTSPDVAGVTIAKSAVEVTAAQGAAR